MSIFLRWRPPAKSTKGFALHQALALALTKARLARFRLGLSEAQRYEIAEDVVQRLQEDGRWPELNVQSNPIALSPSRLPGPHMTGCTIKLARGIV